MMPKILKPEVYGKIENDNNVLADIANALNVSVATVPRMLERKSRRLTEFAVLKVIADFLHVPMDELLIDDVKVES